MPTPPTAAAFWAAAGESVRASGHLRIRAIGPSPGELRYEPDASGTAIDGELVFVCVDSRAFDGQSGFVEVPGTWSCGTEALVEGFRLTGQPLDAWTADLPPDQDIRERVDLLPAGVWQWTYRARNPFVGGQVKTTVRLDPATGQLLQASRTDPLGTTTYGISYSATFPPIEVP